MWAKGLIDCKLSNFFLIVYKLLLLNPKSAAIDVHISDASFSTEHFDIISGVFKFSIPRLGP